MLHCALKGIRVIDFTQVAAGPTCTMLLGDMGADVIKIEPPQGDLSRSLSPFVQGQSVQFFAMNRNKRGVTLDLKDPAQRDEALRLTQTADVVVESNRPGVMERLGLGYPAVKAQNPGVVYCSVSAYGQEGAWRAFPGVDGVLQAISGLMSLIGEPGSPPYKLQVPVVDVMTGHLATLSILAALLQKKEKGTGQFLDVNMFASAMALQHTTLASYLSTGEVPTPIGSAAPYAAPNEALRCQDGWIMVAAYQPDRWAALCTALDAPHLVDHPRLASSVLRLQNRPEMARELEQRLARGTVAQWIARLQAVDIICAPVNDYAQATATPAFQDRVALDVVEMGEADRIVMPGSLWGAGAGPAQPVLRAPGLGEHNQHILGQRFS
jgi:crotonobetainyl-CoA:carnitine CoA-transferase CaiB-like acyl-CoA transferase